MFRSLPSINDTPALYFINYITRYVRSIAIVDSWQIRENNKLGLWGHESNNPGSSWAITDAGNFEPSFIWGNGDTSICAFEFELDSLTAQHKGYYAVIGMKLHSASNDDWSYPPCTLRAVPKPIWDNVIVHPPRLEWDKPAKDADTSLSTFNPILGYSIFRSYFAIGPWTRCDPEGPDIYQPYNDTVFYDSTAPPDTHVYYAIRLVYWPAKVIKGLEDIRIESRLSENSALVSVGIAEVQNQSIKNNELNLKILPNPGTKKVSIRYQIAGMDQKQEVRGKRQDVSLKIFDATGKLINEFEPASASLSNQIIWDRRDKYGATVPNGIYFVSLKTKDRIITKKVILE